MIKPLDPDYFNADPWSKRRSNWISARAATATEFEQAQVAIITETLAKRELSPRCVVNIGADALLKFFKDKKYRNTYDLETGSKRPFPLVGEKHEVSPTRRHVDTLVEFGGPPENFYFGAVALSGSGIRFYGEYCLYLRQDVMESRNPSVLDRNSYDLIHPPLSQRVGTNATDAGPAKIEVGWLKATWNEDLSDMLVMKVAPTIDAENRLVTPGAVAEGVLADEDFAEVHLKGTFTPDEVEEIRFAPEEHALAADILSRIDQGRPPDPAEWLWVWRRSLVDAACDEHAVRRRVTTAAGRTRRWQ
jgi:hypothetical protein